MGRRIRPPTSAGASWHGCLVVALGALRALSAAPAEPAHDADVIVVGLGPVGSFLAQLLASHGVARVLAFEKSAEPYAAPRAVSWDDYTVRSHRSISEDLDVWARWHARILAEQWNVHCAGLKSGNASERWRVGCDDKESNGKWQTMVGASTRQPTVTFHQPSWERRLRRNLVDSSGIEAHFGVEVIDTSVAADGSCSVSVQMPDGAGEAAPSTKTYRSRYCVAVDGGSSRTRRQLGLRYEGKSFPDQPWVVVDTEARDEEYPREAWIGSDASGFVMNPLCPFVFIVTPAFFEGWWAQAEEEAERIAGSRSGAEFAALRDEALDRKAALYRQTYNASQLAAGNIATVPPGSGFRFEFLLEGGLSEAEATSKERVHRMLRECAEVDPERLHVKRAVVYNFHARRAEHWRVGPIFLAGDAAHCMPPFQGQGMNSGIRDAVNLAWKLALVLRGQAAEEILASYEPERRSNLQQVTEDSISLGKTVMMRNPVLTYIRDWIFDLWTRLGDSGWLGAMHHSGWTEPPHIGSRGALLAEGQGVAGRLFPCPEVSLGALRQRLDGLLAPRAFTLVLCGGAGVNASTAVLRASAEHLAFLQGLGAWAVAVGAGSPAASAPPALFGGLGGGARAHDAGAGWVRWTRRYGLEGRIVAVRPDRYVFGAFASVDDAAKALRASLQGPARTSSGAEL